MRRRLFIALGVILVTVVGTTALFRHTYFGQREVPDLRLARPAHAPLTERLVIVLVDSVPFDMAFRPGVLPTIRSWRSRGTWGRGETEEPTMTGQMVYTMATGMRPYITGVLRNWQQNRQPHETWMDGLRSRGHRLEVYGDRPWTEQFGDRFDVNVTWPEEGRTADGKPIVWFHPVNDIDHKVIKHLDRRLAPGAEKLPELLLWHLHGTDLVMHKYLRDSRLTADKLRWADALVASVVSRLDDGRTTFLILSDHGCAANGRHGYGDPEAKSIFYLLFGPQVKKGQRLDLRQVDISPTISTLFGLTPAGPSAGRPAVEAFTIGAADRAARLVAAAETRLAYLKAREARTPSGIAMAAGGVQAAKARLAAGEYGPAGGLATRWLRDRYHADLDARRERSWAWPAASWLLVALGLASLAFLFGLGWPERWRSASEGSPVAHGLAAAAGFGLLFGGSILAAVRSGRWFNDYIDNWEPGPWIGFWAAVAVGIGLAVWALYRPFRRAFAARPAWWLVAVALTFSAMPGYFQGLYSALFVGLGLLWLLGRGDEDGERPWALVLPSIALTVGALIWAYHWRPHLYLTRGDIRGPLAAVGAALAFVIAAVSVNASLRPPHSADSAGAAPRGPAIDWLTLGVTVGVLSGALFARHLAGDVGNRFDFPTAGDHLMNGLPIRLGSVVLMGGLWWFLSRRGLTGPTGQTLGALAVLAAYGSVFEAITFGLLTAALAPLGRLAGLARPGIGRVALAALLFVLARSCFQQPLEFHFNFTAVHDLMRFAVNIDTVLPGLAGPVLLRYGLPTLVLLPLLWGRLSSRELVLAWLLVTLYAGARCLQLLVATRLTIDQLYNNWRGVGELIITGLVALSLALVFGLWWWLGRSELTDQELAARAPQASAEGAADA